MLTAIMEGIENAAGLVGEGDVKTVFVFGTDVDEIGIESETVPATAILPDAASVNGNLAGVGDGAAALSDQPAVNVTLSEIEIGIAIEIEIVTVTATATATVIVTVTCLLYTSPSPRDQRGPRMPSSA